MRQEGCYEVGSNNSGSQRIIDMDEGETLEEYEVERIEGYVKNSKKKKVIV